MPNFKILRTIRHNQSVFRPGDEGALAKEDGVNYPKLNAVGAVKGQPSSDGSGPEATDAAIELAEENGVNLADIDGTGSDGKIIKSDVQNALD